MMVSWVNQGDAENEKMRDVILESSKTLYSCTGRCRLFPFEKLEKLNMWDSFNWWPNSDLYFLYLETGHCPIGLLLLSCLSIIIIMFYFFFICISTGGCLRVALINKKGWVRPTIQGLPTSLRPTEPAGPVRARSSQPGRSRCSHQREAGCCRLLWLMCVMMCVNFFATLLPLPLHVCKFPMYGMVCCCFYVFYYLCL